MAPQAPTVRPEPMGQTEPRALTELTADGFAVFHDVPCLGGGGAFKHLLHRFEIAQHVVHFAALATLNGKVRDLTVREPSLEDVFFGFSD